MRFRGWAECSGFRMYVVPKGAVPTPHSRAGLMNFVAVATGVVAFFLLICQLWRM